MQKVFQVLINYLCQMSQNQALVNFSKYHIPPYSKLHTSKHAKLKSIAAAINYIAAPFSIDLINLIMYNIKLKNNSRGKL